jgi:hypothetical protein
MNSKIYAVTFRRLTANTANGMQTASLILLSVQMFKKLLRSVPISTSVNRPFIQADEVSTAKNSCKFRAVCGAISSQLCCSAS